MSKWKDIVIILLVVAVLIILLRMSKVMQMQNSTLLSVANKLGIEPQNKIEEAECQECEEERQRQDSYDEDDGENENDEEQEEESNPHYIDQTRNSERFENNLKVSKPKHEVPAEPKVRRSQIFVAILELFKDGMPRKRKDIESQFWTSNYFTVPSNLPVKKYVESKGGGYLGDVIQTMKTKSLLGSQYVDLGDKFKSYYYFGLPEWFDNEQLKSEYAEKIGFKIESSKIEEVQVIEENEENTDNNS